MLSLQARSLTGHVPTVHTCPDSGAVTNAVKIRLDRGVPFASAVAALKAFKDDAAAANNAARVVDVNSGYWRSTYAKRLYKTDHPGILLATEARGRSLLLAPPCSTHKFYLIFPPFPPSPQIWTGWANRNRVRLFRVVRPNLGQTGSFNLNELRNNYERVSEAEAKRECAWGGRRVCVVACTHSDACDATVSRGLLVHPLAHHLQPRQPGAHPLRHGGRRVLRGHAHQRGVTRHRRGAFGSIISIRSSPPLFYFPVVQMFAPTSPPQVLPIWQFVASAASRREKDKGMRVVRATTDDGVTHVGLHVPRVAEMDRIIGAVQALDGAAGMSDDEEGGG